MLNYPTLDKLKQLKLSGMVEAFEEQLAQPVNDLDFVTRLGFLVERELIVRENRRLTRRLQKAKLQQHACIENLDYSSARNLKKDTILELASCEWIRQHINILLTGPTGCGKTYLACALAHKACLSGFACKYYRLPRLWEAMKIAQADGTYPQLLNQLSKFDVLILDDWGIVSPTTRGLRDLLEILDDRYQTRTTIITSQLPVSEWHSYLQEDTLADAILDRVVHNTYRIELKGESMRKRNKLNSGVEKLT